jgi:hypothetical protein
MASESKKPPHGRDDKDLELRMRCIEAGTDIPFSNDDQVVQAAQTWYEWIVAPPTPPQGRTTAARKRLEESKR